LLVFATNPDNVASDGAGRNGAYTKHLLQYIKQPGLEVGMMLRKIRTAVKEETEQQQVPWENGSMKRTPSSRQKRAKIKIDCYKDELK
jgi:uncharacterized caspase-like protein